MSEVDELKQRVALLESKAQTLLQALDAEFLSDEARKAQHDLASVVEERVEAGCEPAPITVQYTNWKGETRNRTIVPLSVWFGHSDFHEGDQWFVQARDVEKDAVRNFALADMSGALPFQDRVAPWMDHCFGEKISNDTVERNHRFLEEALELVQACGCSRREALQMVDYVFNRDIGHKPQEVGGVMVTLAALCLAQKIDMHECGEVELKRIWVKAPQIREKQANKPEFSPLPQFVPEDQQTSPEQFVRDALDRIEFAANSAGIDSIESLIRWLPHMEMRVEEPSAEETQH